VDEEISSTIVLQTEFSQSAASFVEADISSIESSAEQRPATEEETNVVNETACIDGVVFVCTVLQWCSLSDFEPKVGQYWTLIWSSNDSACGDSVAVDNITTDGGKELEIIEPTPAGASTHPCPDEAWSQDQVYAEGDKITASGQIFSCKEFPYSLWCGTSGYQPLVDPSWGMAWDLKGLCDYGEAAALPVSPTPRPTYAPPTLTVYQPTEPSFNKPAEPSVVEPSESSIIEPAEPSIIASPTPKPFRPVAPSPTPPASSSSGFVEISKDPTTTQQVFDILDQKSSRIDSELFLYDTGTEGYIESTIYRYQGFRDGLEVMHEDGAGGSYFYLGGGSEIGYKIAMTNIAAFFAQSMKETIKYDACDENSWDLIGGKYPLSNACGQLGQSYQEYHCPEDERHMECDLDPNMKITAVTSAKWYGAPAPLFCGPKEEIPFTGFWDYGYECNKGWADPPETCDVYEGQKAGKFDNSNPFENTSGRTDVESCCWWGRGVIQTTGVCNFGKLNYYLGARAASEGRPSRYPDVDFCKDPEQICSSDLHKELKWVAGLFYWINSVQAYKEGDFDYVTELHKFVENGMEGDSFINAVSGIVNRGCHNPPCGAGPVDGADERAANFRKVLAIFFE
jgi:predicted chitinase